MLIFTSAYIFLALTSWSALAVPLPGSESDNSAQTNSLYSATANGDTTNYYGLGPAADVAAEFYQTSSNPSGMDSTPPDCGSKSKPPPHSDDKSDPQGNSPDVTGATPATDTTTTPTSTGPGPTNTGPDPTNTGPDPTNPGPDPTNPGPGPAIARRRFRGGMRRDRKASPGILRRDGPATSASNNPITLDDILDRLIQQRAVSRKRAEKPRTSRGVY